MLHALRELAPEMGLTLGVAHFDHKIRGEASDADAQFVAGIATQLGVGFHPGEADVPALAAEGRLSTETAAREARYAFLRRTAAACGYSRIAVGHTRDDQAETVLLAVVRGSGLAGLGGMAPLAGDIARPLLEATRAEVMAYLEARRLAFRTDETNFSLDHTRNRVRHVLVPLLETEFNPDVKGALARLADTLRADEDYLAQTASDFVRMAAGDVLAGAGRPLVVATQAAAPLRQVRLDLAVLRKAPLAIQRRAVREAARLASGAEVSPLTFANVEDVLGLLDGKTGGSIDLPAGLGARLGYGYLELAASPAPAGRAAPPSPGVLAVAVDSMPFQVASGPWQLSFEVLPREAGPPVAERKWRCECDSSGSCSFRAVLDFDRLKHPFAVRPQRRGDRFWPHGAPGERKLQDFLTDAKVPRTERGFLPLLVDASGRVAAVMPLRAAHWATVDEQTRRVLAIEGLVGSVPFLARSLRSC
jgi:tRNA(Ile)-lysidine synthase